MEKDAARWRFDIFQTRPKRIRNVLLEEEKERGAATQAKRLRRKRRNEVGEAFAEGEEKLILFQRGSEKEYRILDAEQLYTCKAK